MKERHVQSRFSSVLALLALAPAILCLPGCKKRAASGSKREQICRDFSLQVTAVCRADAVTSLQPSAREVYEQRLAKLGKNILERCVSGNIPQKEVECVLMLHPKTYPSVRNCLPSVEFPEQPGATTKPEDEDEE